MQIKYLKDIIQMISTMREAKLHVPNRAKETNLLQDIPKSGEYETHHLSSQYVLGRVDPGRSSEIMSQILLSLG